MVDNDVRVWADEVCKAIAEAIHLVFIDDQKLKENRRIVLLSQISALINTGRWYFPNLFENETGMEKVPAYRGVRQPVLDCVATAYSIPCNTPEADEILIKHELIECQRAFVSHIQLVLDPRKREEEIARVLNEFLGAEKLRKGKSRF